MGVHDESSRQANQLMYGVESQFEANLVRQQPAPGFSAGAAYGAGIGNLSGWVAFFGTIGLILSGIATRSWIGAIGGALAFAAFPAGIAFVARRLRRSHSPRNAEAPPLAARARTPRSLWSRVLLYGLLGGAAGVAFAVAIEAPDAASVVALVGAGAGATLAVLVWVAGRLFRRS